MNEHEREYREPPSDELPPEPSAEEGETSFESNPETEPQRESIDTVRQLLDQWHEEYELTDDGDQKRELAYRLVKMSEAIYAAGLTPEGTKVREAGPGILGFYVPSTGEVAITTAGVALPPEHFAHVLKHEAGHAQGMADEGLNELSIRSAATLRVYPHEQQSAVKTFDRVGIDRALEKYDFEKPEELIELYLEVEWQDTWRDRWQHEVNLADMATSEEQKEVLAGPMKPWTEEIEKALAEAAPRLLDKAKQQGFDFAAVHQAQLAKLVEAEQSLDRAA